MIHKAKPLVVKPPKFRSINEVRRDKDDWERLMAGLQDIQSDRLKKQTADQCIKDITEYLSVQLRLDPKIIKTISDAVYRDDLPIATEKLSNKLEALEVYGNSDNGNPALREAA